MTDISVIRPDWDAPANVVACTSTRRGGVSQGEWAELNLADHVGDDISHVLRNRQLLSDHLQLPSPPVWLQQVHGCDVAVADQLRSIAACDAGITSKQQVVCAVLTADCLPLLLCNQQGNRIAAVHAGWRGLAAGVIEQTVEKMQCDHAEILVWLGPAIGPKAFEVGGEVRQVFIDADIRADSAFTQITGEKWLCNLYKLARIRLDNLGVLNVSGGDFCTHSDADRFYSYRRDGVTGRMASLIWIIG
jgi:YfiH family protein